MKPEKDLSVTEISGFEQKSLCKLPLFTVRIPAGFPSPGDDYVDRKLDLNEFLIKHPAATFFVKVEGDSMIDAGIHSGDILIVDRALEAGDNDIVIAQVNGELTVKRIRTIKNKLYLMPENPAFQPIRITPEMSFDVRGVVTYVIHPAR